MLFRNDKKDNRDATSNVVPLFPLRELIVFPHEVYPIFVGRQKSIKALEAAEAKKTPILLVTQKDPKVAEPAPGDLYTVGTLGVVVQLLRLPDGTVKALVEGKKRARVLRYVADEEYFQVEAEEIEEVNDRSTEVEALMRSVVSTFDNYARLNKKIPPEMVTSIAAVDDPAFLADKLVGHLGIKLEDKQALLESTNPAERLEKILGYMRSELEILEVEKRIRSRVKKQMEKTSKEYYLNEQMRAIQKELGEKDEFKNEIQELEEKLRQKKMPAEAREKCEREIKKLKMMSPMSAEATVVRNYLDWFLALPWFEYTEDKLDIKEAERVLEEDHYGLDKVKQRILEYLAVETLVGQMKGPILCLVGPPGVGKTSLGKSVARATGRKFVRVSLGGVRDEAEIRGHRRTYIGALPGKVIQSVRKAGSSNPVLLFDEVDKMSTDFRGDPSSALLEVLDPEQNCTFNDHYLDCDYDLSKVMFITTANTLDRIPRPLQDRMEVIRIPGYTETEKLNIAKKYLLKKQQEANGLRPENIEVSDGAIQGIIRHYTREAGVRNLERELASICRKVAVEVVKTDRNAHTKVSSSSLPKYLGVPKFRYGTAETVPQVGVATGLAWTELGGELLERRSDDRAGTRQADYHRPARRRDAGIGAGGALLRALARRSARTRSRLLSSYRHPHSYSRRRDSEGRTVGGNHAGDGAGLGAHALADSQRPCDDRRDHAARTRAADWRTQGKGARGASRRYQDHPDTARTTPRTSRRSRRRS